MLRRWLTSHRIFAGFLLGLVFSGGSALVVAVCVVQFGFFDVAATTPHSAGTAWIVHTTMTRAVKRLAEPGSIPIGATPAQIRHGFHEYEEHCVMCHGGPGVARARWVRGLLPTPPFLLDAQRRWTPAELDFIITHGIKMTAMPAWGLSQRRGDVADIVRFVERLPNISPARYLAMRQAHGTAPHAGSGTQPTEVSNR